MAIIECKNVTLGYDGLVAVSDLNFSVEEQDYFCIIGDNGTGKSTLLKALLGLKRVSSGSIVLGDGLRRNQIGYLAQQTEVQKEFPASVREVILSGCMNKRGLRPFYSAADKKRVEAAMETLSISRLKGKCYKELSGGQQQRVLLARALCAAERLLVLDEPTTGLDPQMTTEFFSFIRQMNAEQGIAVIMVTHDTHCAVKYSKHILHLLENDAFFGTTEEYIDSELGKKYIGGHRHD
ncbi:metal ABC transporter ATP-binding protein [Ructibacterium gallinarum]|uniref:ABC transporter ATP-binding protein n=1 Tax=Ructibacterium gallinarum TaxID=2779355 RepID=A0A9D5M1Y6_9FIRM|nr:ABC transporter ATP-binding protein [Ructibacterium gallinarum]MBE5040815.1 ABC transporter ATP-binding protein [Ructibacterium gallinarum]